jgi:putative transposase
MLRALFALLNDVLASRQRLVLENLALRQQLAAFKAAGLRPRVHLRDRLFWVLLRRLWRGWRSVLVFVGPDTVVRWHRAGFRAYWARLSRRRRLAGRPPVDVGIRALIRRMAADNPTWGAPRIHGELLMLGMDVSERTVSRLMPRRPTGGSTIARWMAFLRNHSNDIAAMDFFTVPTVTFRVLYVLFVIHHGARRIRHFAVTQHPTAAWVCQQLREAFPYDAAPRHLVFDRDSTFSAQVVQTMRHMGTSPARTAYRSPWQNGVAERWVGSVRRELLQHVIVFGEPQLYRLLRQYIAYYHDDRSHLGLAKQTPGARPVQPRPFTTAPVVALPRIGGLHHRYEWHAAA